MCLISTPNYMLYSCYSYVYLREVLVNVVTMTKYSEREMLRTRYQKRDNVRTESIVHNRRLLSVPSARSAMKIRDFLNLSQMLRLIVCVCEREREYGSGKRR